MSPDLYARAFALTRGWGLGARPEPMLFEAVPTKGLSSGIYITTGGDKVVRYVGSAHRPGDPGGLARRLGEHSLQRRMQWAWVWVIPLRESTPIEYVRAIEGQIIDLLKPRMNKAHHRLQWVPPYPSGGLQGAA